MSVTVPVRFSSKQEASLVEVAGSYNNWTTAAMTKNPESSEDWTISLNLNPGTHQYKFIVDGEWKHDSECVTTDDNKGGLNNIITVAGDLSNKDLQFLVNTTSKSEKEVKDYYKLFKMRHPTGNIDMKEYKKMTTGFIKKITSKCDPDVVCDYAFKSYNKDANGFISFREACHAMYVNRDGGTKEEKAKYSFHMYDINKSGTIEKKELYHWIIGMLVLHGEKLGKDDLAKMEIKIEEMIGQLDTNKDGVISEEEFVSGCIKDYGLYSTLCCYQEFLYATRDQYEIPKSQITLIRKLGAGNFGQVWKGQWQGRVDVAVKILKPNTMSPEAFLQEAEIMKKFSHPHLVAMYAVCTEQEPFYIITEYMCDGALLDYLRKETGEGTKMTFDSLISVNAQVANGMTHLERKGLIHRDLAARNVLIGENLITKVADFGLVRVIVDNEYSAHQGDRFPVKWTAPEAIQFGKFTVKSDVWSFGILLMECFTYGQVPYPGMNNREVIDQVERGYRMAPPTHMIYPESKEQPKEVQAAGANVYKIMLECWNRDPFKRPTFEFLTHMLEDFNITTQPQYME